MRWLPVCVAVALGGGAVLGASMPDRFWLAGLAALAAWTLAVWAWHRVAARLLLASALAGVVAVGAMAGGVAMRRVFDSPLVAALVEADQWPDEGRSASPTRLEGVLTADAWTAGPVVLLRVRVERVWVGPCRCPADVDDEVQLSVGGTLASAHRDQWRAGRRVMVEAALRRPAAFRNSGAPDEARARARRRIAAVGQVKSALQIQVQRGSAGSEAFAALRADARRAIARAVAPDTTAAAVATAILIGDRTGLEPALEARLQRAGTFHVVAISGGNIALWAAGTIWLTGRLTRRRVAALVGAAAILVAYAALVGGGASVERATGMALVGLAARWADQRGAAVNVLALTAAALVAVDPLLVVDVAFWLTTAATLGLVIGVPDGTSPRPAAVRLLHALVLTSVCAELALLPIVASVFQQVTLAGLLLSALAMPAMAVVQVAALTVVALDPLAPWLATAAGAAVTLAVRAVTDSAAIVDHVPGLAWAVPPPSLLPVVVYYGALAGWLWLRAAGGAATVRPRRAALTLVAVSAAWIAVSPATLLRWRPGALELVTFDVGQGAAAVVHFPGGRRMLVDAGGVTGRGADLGARVVAPALRARGIRWLDTVVVTHADLDHAGGAASIVRGFRPAEVWTGIPVAGDAVTAGLREAAASVGAAWREVRRGEAIEIDGVRVAVVHPPPPDWERQRVRNDDSVVLAFEHGGVRIVLPGDAGVEVEAEIAAALARAGDRGGGRHGSGPPSLTVLAAGHHGSAGSTSEAWLEALQPGIAVVSAGQANPFGHPAAATLARLRAAGADVWRTDRDGEVTVRVDERGVVISSVAGRRGPVVVPVPQPR